QPEKASRPGRSARGADTSGLSRTGPLCSVPVFPADRADHDVFVRDGLYVRYRQIRLADDAEGRGRARRRLDRHETAVPILEESYNAPPALGPARVSRC